VDDLGDTQSLEASILASEVLLVFLAGTTSSEDGAERSSYMHSANCLLELRTALKAQKRVVFIHETDPSHGGISIEAHKYQCPEELRQVFDEHLIVPWYRLREFLNVSLRRIAETVTGLELCIPGALLSQPLHLTPLGEGGFHLFILNNTSELSRLLLTEAPELRITSNPCEQRLAERSVLYLNGLTWTDAGCDAPNLDVLQAQTATILAAGAPLMLIHEQREGRHAVPFGNIIERTPTPLRDQGVFKTIAIPLYDSDEHQRTALRLLLGTSSRTSHSHRPRTFTSGRIPLPWKRSKSYLLREQLMLKIKDPISLEMQPPRTDAHASCDGVYEEKTHV
jgi:hypothetical protein